MLTIREVQILVRLRDGWNYKAIAADLGVSYYTVKFYMRLIYAKLGAENNTEAVVIAIRRGLIKLGD